MAHALVKRGLKASLRWLYWLHRWLGIAVCLMFLLWFVSGVVMMYVPYPSLTEEERLAGLAPIDWSRVRISPTEALRRAGQQGFPAELRLDMAAGEPAWRIRDKQRRIALSALDGRRLSAPDAASAIAAARRFAGAAPITRVERIHDDQWTVAQGFKWARPLWKVSLGDARGTQIYVSSTSGEPVQNTDARERAWNWVGAVPHWLYLTAIRRDGSLWRQVVLWTSGPAVVLGITGMWVGILRLRLRWLQEWGDNTLSRLDEMAPSDRTGRRDLRHYLDVQWMAFGQPFRLVRAQWAVGGAALYAAHASADFPVLDGGRLAARAPQAREARLAWVGGRPVVTLTVKTGHSMIATPDGRALRFTQAELVANARRLMPGTPVRNVVVLQKPDLYWYSHRHERTLPVVRVIFGDAERTWTTIDPRGGSLLSQQNASGRSYRWFFNALHDFDLPFLLANRFLREPLMWLLSALGIIMSLSGIVIGWNHLVRRRRRKAARQAIA
ncbi:hypothetical protein ACFSLT_20715 [Novosphingobium resinovorum]